MKQFLLIMLSLLLFIPNLALAEDTTILKTGITIEESVPDILFGEWRVQANLLTTNSNENFKKNNVDLWNISRKNSVITLDNPFSGAKASVSIKEVVGNKVIFEKEGRYENQILRDSVELTLNSDSFSGVNYITLITISDIDGHVINTKTAKYSLIGDKISGQNVLVEE